MLRPLCFLLLVALAVALLEDCERDNDYKDAKGYCDCEGGEGCLWWDYIDLSYSTPTRSGKKVASTGGKSD